MLSVVCCLFAKLLCFCADVHWSCVIAQTIDMAGPVDILVNNAGIVSGKWLLDLTEEVSSVCI